MDKYMVRRYYMVAVMLVLAFIAYESFTQPLPTRRPDTQSILGAQVPEAHKGPPTTASPVANGDALIYMRIPRFGKDWLWTAQEGVSLDVLANGPGHYPETPLPGEDGNSAFAAHRAGHGDPFINFEQLEIGDDVYLSQKDATWTYEITTKPEIINPDGDWVLDTFAPGKWLTLTTCWPKYGSEKRMYVRAKLVDVEVDKDAGSV
jgi:sortase A